MLTQYHVTCACKKNKFRRFDLCYPTNSLNMISKDGMLWDAFDHMTKKQIKDVISITVSQPCMNVLPLSFFSGTYICYPETLLDFYKDQYLFDRSKNWNIFLDKAKRFLQFVFGPY